jgi:hypothetical protein
VTEGGHDGASPQEDLSLAGMVSLVVVSTGAFRNAVNVIQANSMPAQAVLLYGAIFAASLAYIYVPAYFAMQAQGRKLIEELCGSVPGKETSPEVVMERRQVRYPA